MQENEIIDRIKFLCESRSWSLYRLAKESNITYSTLCTMLHKANAPSIPSLIKICNGFGISLSEFFDTNNDVALLTTEEKEYLHNWNKLSDQNKQIANKYISYLLSEQNKIS